MKNLEPYELMQNADEGAKGAKETTQGIVGSSVAQGGADPAVRTERGLNFNTDAVAEQMAATLGITVEQAKRRVQDILDIAKMAQQNNLEGAKARWDSILKLETDAATKNADMFRIPEQAAASMTFVLKLFKSICERAGWTGASEFFQGLMDDIKPKAVYADSARVAALDPSKVAPADFVKGALNAYGVDSNRAEALATEALGDTARAAGVAGDKLNTLPGVPTVAPNPGGAESASPGRVTRQEWESLVGSSGIDPKLQKPIVDGFFAAADKNKDGSLDQAEVAVVNGLVASGPTTKSYAQPLKNGLTLELAN